MEYQLGEERQKTDSSVLLQVFITSANARRGRSHLLILTSAFNNNRKEVLSVHVSKSVTLEKEYLKKITPLQLTTSWEVTNHSNLLCVAEADKTLVLP